MDWKEFLRPTIANLLLALALFLLFAPVIDYSGCPECVYSKPPCMQACKAPITGSAIMGMFILPARINSILYPNAVTCLALSYLVSCAFVHFLAQKKAKQKNTGVKT